MLRRLVMLRFLPVFFASLGTFVLIIQMIDLFANIVRYLNQEVPFASIAHVQALYMPEAFIFAVPIALVFAVSYTMGSLFAENELIAVFASGVPIWRFVMPILLLGAALSIATFLLQELVAIDTHRKRNELSRQLLNITRSFSVSEVTVRTADGRWIYTADYFNDVTNELSGVIVLERDRQGRLLRRIDATSATWEDRFWQLRDAEIVSIDAAGRVERERNALYSDPSLDQAPARFRSGDRSIDELSLPRAGVYIRELRDAGRDIRGELTVYHERLAFAFTPFVVLFISAGLGGRLKNNVLIWSLGLAVAASVVYYVLGFVGGLAAAGGLVPPAIGAWSGVVLYLAFGVWAFRTART